MNKFQLTKFKVNASIATETADLNKTKSTEFARTVNYPSLQLMMSENSINLIEEVRVVTLSGSYTQSNTEYAPRIFVPIIGGDKCSIKFKDGTEFKLTTAFALESIEYTIEVPEGAELKYLVLELDYSKSTVKFAPAAKKLEFFCRNLV
jgi:hypothetical protein